MFGRWQSGDRLGALGRCLGVLAGQNAECDHRHFAFDARRDDHGRTLQRGFDGAGGQVEQCAQAPDRPGGTGLERQLQALPDLGALDLARSGHCLDERAAGIAEFARLEQRVTGFVAGGGAAIQTGQAGVTMQRGLVAQHPGVVMRLEDRPVAAAGEPVHEVTPGQVDQQRIVVAGDEGLGIGVQRGIGGDVGVACPASRVQAHAQPPVIDVALELRIRHVSRGKLEAVGGALDQRFARFEEGVFGAGRDSGRRWRGGATRPGTGACGYQPYNRSHQKGH